MQCLDVPGRVFFSELVRYILWLDLGIFQDRFRDIQCLHSNLCLLLYCKYISPYSLQNSFCMFFYPSPPLVKIKVQDRFGLNIAFLIHRYLL